MKVESRDALAAEGLTVELIRQLGTVPGLTVLAPMSTLAAGGSQDGALQMGANAILDCRLEGTKLQASLSRVEGNVARAALDLATYQLYLAGRAWFHRWSPDNLVQAQGCFEEVLARNPGFAPAWAGLADIQVLRAYWHAAVPRPVLEQGLVCAQKAADLDPGCGDSYCSLAAVTAARGRDWEKAEMLFRLAIESNHSNALALNWLAIVLLVPQLRFAEAVDAVFAAYDLDPASPEIGNEIVWVRICCGQYGEAADQARRIVELHPLFVEACWSLAVAESASGNHVEAMAALDRADRAGGPMAMTVALRCFADGARGDIEAARGSLARLEGWEDGSAVRAIFRAWAYAAIGDVEEGIRHLEQAVDDADPHAMYVEVFPPNARLRSHPRYPGILTRQRLRLLSAAASREP